MRLVEGDLRDRDLVHDLTAGCDLVFHQAAIRITQCAEEPRLALEVLVDGTFNVIEAAAQHQVDKLVAASSASVYGLAEEFPTTERSTRTTTTPSTARRRRFNEGMLRSFRAMSGLDYVALRYFNVYGPRMDIHGLYTEVLIRWMERIAAGKPPLIFGDGRQTMDFVFTTDIARANLLAAASDVTEGVYNVASGVETSLEGLAEALLAAMDSDLGVEHGPDRPVNGVTRRLASTEAAAPRPRLHRRDRPRPTVCVGWSTGGAASGARPVESAEPARRRDAGMSRDQRDAALPRRGGDRGGHRGAALRLGGPGSAGRRVRGGVRRRPCRPSTRSPCRPAPRRCTWP